MLAQGSLTFLAALALIVAISGFLSWRSEQAAPPIGAFIDVEGGRLHYKLSGPKDSARLPIILIHGASVNLRDMELALGERLARDRLVLTIDRPGRGYSDRPADGHLLTRQAQMIQQAALALGLERPIVLGQSFGGAVALSYALQYQEDMAGLVLLAPVSHEWPGGVAWYNDVSQIPGLGFLLRRLVIPIYGRVAARAGVEETFAPFPAPENYFEGSGLALLFRPKDFRANAADLALLKRQIKAQQELYTQLDLPVAIAAGPKDRTVYTSIHAEALAREVAGAALTLVEDALHPIHHTHRDEALALIADIDARAAERTRSAGPMP